MRQSLLILVLVAAVGTLGWFVLSPDPVEEGQHYDMEGEPIAPGSDSSGRSLRVEDISPVGVYRTDEVRPLQGDFDFGAALENTMTLSKQGGDVKGAAFLEAWASQVGGKLPIRFARASALESFRDSVLPIPEEERGQPMDLRRALDVFVHSGLHVEERAGFMLIRKHEEKVVESEPYTPPPKAR